jgi:phosphopantothenoylcysteine decarboxylase/phosphopantothenate--cysteine ligase
MGHAIALCALRRGAEVVLISGPTRLPPPAGAVYVPVETAEEMRLAVLQHLDTATLVLKAAAVADYRVKLPASSKIKSSKDQETTLTLSPNPDILREVAARKGERFVVGFAAETDDVRRNALAKLAAKGIDLLVVNDVSQAGIGFESDDNQVTLLDPAGGAIELPRMSKQKVADAILDRVLVLRAARSAPSPSRHAG